MGLRRQLIVSFVVFAVALGGLFGGVTLLVFHRVEDHLMQKRLEELLETPPQTHTSTRVSYAGGVAAAPAPIHRRLAGLEPGFHEW